jgi:small subunit ribosomal protein S17
MSEISPAVRGHRKHITGIVTSRSGDKTVKVTSSYKVPHPLYRKETRRQTVLHVHDELNTCKLGDKVEIVETRPLSKSKRWRLLRVVVAAPEVAVANV